MILVRECNYYEVYAIMNEQRQKGMGSLLVRAPVRAECKRGKQASGFKVCSKEIRPQALLLTGKRTSVDLRRAHWQQRRGIHY